MVAAGCKGCVFVLFQRLALVFLFPIGSVMVVVIYRLPVLLCHVSVVTGCRVIIFTVPCVDHWTIRAGVRTKGVIGIIIFNIVVIPLTRLAIAFLFICLFPVLRK